MAARTRRSRWSTRRSSAERPRYWRPVAVIVAVGIRGTLAGLPARVSCRISGPLTWTDYVSGGHDNGISGNDKQSSLADAVARHVRAGDVLHPVVGHARWSAATREVVR